MTDTTQPPAETLARAVALAKETLAGHPHGKDMPDLALAWLANRAELHAQAVVALDAALTRRAGGDAGVVEDAVSAVLERWDAHSGDVDERNRLIARLRASFSAEGK